MDAFLLHRLPVWAVFLVVVAIVIVSMRLGFFLGDRERKRGTGGGEGPVGSVLGSTLGLLAFILAITFGGASSRFEARKQLMLEDVNAIATVARRADLLPAPHPRLVRTLLRRYVDLRLQVASDPRTLSQAMAETDTIQARLWEHAVLLSRTESGASIGLYVTALNQMMTVHTSRKTVALVYRIPDVIWTGLLVLLVFAMAAVGFQFGVVGKGGWHISLALAGAFAAVITIIALLDRTTQDAIRVSDRPMLELRRMLGPDGPSG